jgi:putative phosphonate transport system ATP-binding protein
MADQRLALRVRNVTKWYPVRVTQSRSNAATNVMPGLGCRDISFDIPQGRVVGIVGESGSGKTTVLRCCSGLLRPSSGSITLADNDGRHHQLDECDATRLHHLKRTSLGFVGQHPAEHLRLNLTAGANIAERLMGVGVMKYEQLRSEAAMWLSRVEIPASRLDDLPATFSGGMQQRLQIARALAPRPQLLLLDEPTGGLDVSVQATIIDLLRELVRTLRVSVLLVTHDLGVARLLADHLLVMRQGQIIESGIPDRVLDDPHHEYTQLLVSSAVAP